MTLTELAKSVKKCPRCGGSPSWAEVYAWHVTCPKCYDGAPDAGRQEHGFALKLSDAVSSWNEQVDEYVEEHAS